MAQSGVPSWSQTAATNATIDPTVNFAEGQAPSSVNDSARALMAGVAKYRDDMAGALITGGTSTAYTLTSNTGFFSKATMNGAEISFTVSATNGASPTLNVDGLGADPITLDGTIPVPTGTLIAGSIYTAMYYNTGNAWRLKDFYQVPFIVPIGGMIDYFGTSAPSSNFVFPYGQAISRTTYAALFALLGTTYGAGDGTTTFNIPDLRGRVTAGKDDMGGVAASRLTASVTGVPNGAVLGGVGGSQDHTLTTSQLASHSHSVFITDPGHAHSGAFSSVNSYNSPGGATNVVQQINVGVTSTNTTGIIIGAFAGSNSNATATAGSGAAHNNVQPTIVVNKLFRII